jgi:hypothetical protein
LKGVAPFSLARILGDSPLLGGGKRCGGEFNVSGGCTRPFCTPGEAAPPVKSGLRAISDGIAIVVVVIRRAAASGYAGMVAGSDAALYEACCTPPFSACMGGIPTGAPWPASFGISPATAGVMPGKSCRAGSPITTAVPTFGSKRTTSVISF